MGKTTITTQMFSLWRSLRKLKAPEGFPFRSTLKTRDAQFRHRYTDVRQDRGDLSVGAGVSL